MKRKAKVVAAFFMAVFLIVYGLCFASFPMMGYFMILFTIYGALFYGLKGGVLFALFSNLVFIFSYEGSVEITISASVTVLIVGVIGGRFSDIIEGQKRYNRALLETIPGMVALHTIEGDFIDVVGPREFLEGENIDKILPEDVSEKIKKSLKKAQIKNKIQTVEYGMKVGDKKRHYQAKINYFKGDKALVHIDEITERKEIEEKLKFESCYDSLTGINNRFYAEKILDEMNNRKNISLVVIDVNGLKIVNDIFGHEEGDKLLIKMAKILNESCRKEDYATRWGGDEFLLILPNVSSKAAKKVVERITKRSKKEEAEFGRPISFAAGIATKRTKSEDIFKTIAIADDKMYKDKFGKSKEVKNRMIKNIFQELESRSDETEKHRQRVVDLSVKLGKKIGLSDLKIKDLKLAAKYHDVGKVSVPEEIMNKERALRVDEWEKVKIHCEKGHQILSFSDELAKISVDVLHHHECWDGSGYPKGLKEDDIPLNSRIISLADSFVVMTTKKPYSKKMSKKEALSEISRLSGKQFDPNLVENFIQIM